MKKTFLFLIVLCYFFSTKVQAQENKNLYIFGHSLILHQTNQQETTVPHWLHFFAEHNGNSIAAAGQYGFLPQHDNLPPTSQWGFQYVTPAWDSDTETFAEADFNTVLLTAGNFVQYKPSNENYDGAENMTSPVLSTLNILDWLEDQEPSIITYIYENWPDMGGFTTADEIFTSTSFPTSEEFDNYNTYTQSEFHDWWVDYQDFIQAERPEENVRLIPVGSIMSKLLTQAPLNQIPIIDLYEDNAPHGRPTIYFLSGLITYMAMYEEKFPADYIIPDTVSDLIQPTFQDTIDFIWDELLAFNYDDGTSRVFVNSVLSVEENELTPEITVFPNPTNDYITISGTNNITKIDLYDIKGSLIATQKNMENQSIDISGISKGIYLVKISTSKKGLITRRIIVE